MASAPMPGLTIGEHDADEGARLAGTVDTGRFQHLGGDALTELLHQKTPKGQPTMGKNDGPDGIVKVQCAHPTQQRDEDDLLGQGHCADDEGEEQPAADEALLPARSLPLRR